jgi:hypothetical protein
MRAPRLIPSTVLGLSLMVAVATMALGAPAAMAAAPKSASASTPVDAAAGGPIDVQIWPGQAGKTAVITVVEVDAKTKLPATVRIPVMPGTTVEWAGEILGGPAESDVQQAFKLVQGQGGQFAEFTLTKSRRGQIDAIGFPIEMSGDKVLIALEYVQSVSSPLTAISVRIPANVSKVKIEPKPSGDPVDNADGETLYSLKPKAYEPGEKQKVTLSYSTVPPAVPAPGSDLNPVLIGLGIALAVVVIAMMVVLSRRPAPVPAAEDLKDEEAAVETAEGTPDDARPSDGDDDEPDLDFD